MMCLGLMGTSCIRSGGVVYKIYTLKKCPPATYTMPLWVTDDGHRVEIEDKPVWECPVFSSYLFYKNRQSTASQYFATISKENNGCQLVVGFIARFQGMASESELADIKNSYNYQIGVGGIDDFARTLVSGTALKISTSQDLNHTDAKTDLRGWCKAKGGSDG